MLQKLEALRQDLIKMLEADDYDEDELIKKSEELDKYIVRAMKELYHNYIKEHKR